MSFLLRKSRRVVDFSVCLAFYLLVQGGAYHALYMWDQKLKVSLDNFRCRIRRHLAYLFIVIRPWSIYRMLPSFHILLLTITCRIVFSSALADILDDLFVLFQITVIFLKEKYYLPVIIGSVLGGLLALIMITVILFKVSSTLVK